MILKLTSAIELGRVVCSSRTFWWGLGKTGNFHCCVRGLCPRYVPLHVPVGFVVASGVNLAWPYSDWTKSENLNLNFSSFNSSLGKGRLCRVAFWYLFALRLMRYRAFNLEFT
jgi:hypothetical protein